MADNKNKSWWRRDIRLNVSPKEGILRLFIALALPTVLFVYHPLYFIIIISGIAFYLFVTGTSLFCFIKYFWRHKILNKTDPKVKDPDFPVEKL